MSEEFGNIRSKSSLQTFFSVCSGEKVVKNNGIFCWVPFTYLRQISDCVQNHVCVSDVDMCVGGCVCGYMCISLWCVCISIYVCLLCVWPVCLPRCDSCVCVPEGVRWGGGGGRSSCGRVMMCVEVSDLRFWNWHFFLNKILFLFIILFYF